MASVAVDRKGTKIQYDILSFNPKHKNKAEFKCLDDSEVLSSGFPGLKTSSASMTTSMTSTASMASMTSTASFHQKNYWSWWFDHP